MEFAVATQKTFADVSWSHVRNDPNTRAVVPASVRPELSVPAKVFSISFEARLVGVGDYDKKVDITPLRGVPPGSRAEQVHLIRLERINEPGDDVIKKWIVESLVFHL